MVAQIQAFLAKYNVTTHVIGAVVFLIGAFSFVPQFHDLVLAIYNWFPGWGKTLITTAIALYAFYRKGNPGPKAPAADVSKLAALSMIAVLMMGTMAGCTGNQVAQDIVNWTPTVEAAVATVDTTASLLLPADAPIFAIATAGFDAAANELNAQAKAYLANPNATVLGKLQTAVVTFEQTVNAAMLQAVAIKDPASQKHALAAISQVSVVVQAILGLVQSISSKTAVAAMAAAAPIKVSMVRRYLDDGAVQSMAQRYGATADAFYGYESRLGF